MAEVGEVELLVAVASLGAVPPAGLLISAKAAAEAAPLLIKVSSFLWEIIFFFFVRDWCLV